MIGAGARVATVQSIRVAGPPTQHHSSPALLNPCLETQPAPLPLRVQAPPFPPTPDA